MKKGVVFTTDAALALTVTLLVLAVTLHYIRDADMSRWSDLNMMRVAYDLGLALDREGVLASNNRTLVEGRLNRTSPPNYAVHLSVERYVFVNGTSHLVGVNGYGETSEGDRMTEKIISSDSVGGYYLTYVGVALR